MQSVTDMSSEVAQFKHVHCHVQAEAKSSSIEALASITDRDLLVPAVSEASVAVKRLLSEALKHSSIHRAHWHWSKDRAPCICKTCYYHLPHYSKLCLQEDESMTKSQKKRKRSSVVSVHSVLFPTSEPRH